MIKLSAFADEADTVLEGQIKALKDNNISYLEMRSINDEDASIMSEKKAKEYYKKLFDNGISVWSIGSFLGKTDINCKEKDFFDSVKRVCEIAKIFKTEKIRMFSFYKAYNYRNKVIDFLNKMVEIATEYDLTLYHENEKDIYGDTVDRCIDILDNVKGLKCVYDPANFIQCGQKADYSISKLFDRTDYFHIKDVIEETGEIVPAGYGNGKIDDIISKINNDKVFTIEPHLNDFVGYSTFDNTEMKHKLSFNNQREAFDFAVKAIKNLLNQNGYKERNGEFVK